MIHSKMVKIVDFSPFEKSAEYAFLTTDISSTTSQMQLEKIRLIFYNTYLMKMSFKYSWMVFGETDRA